MWTGLHIYKIGSIKMILRKGIRTDNMISKRCNGIESMECQDMKIKDEKRKSVV